MTLLLTVTAELMKKKPSIRSDNVTDLREESKSAEIPDLVTRRSPVTSKEPSSAEIVNLKKSSNPVISDSHVRKSMIFRRRIPKTPVHVAQKINSALEKLCGWRGIQSHPTTEKEITLLLEGASYQIKDTAFLDCIKCYQEESDVYRVYAWYMAFTRYIYRKVAVASKARDIPRIDRHWKKVNDGFQFLLNLYSAIYTAVSDETKMKKDIPQLIVVLMNSMIFRVTI